MFEIENGVPVPPNGMYPWKEMRVGDSFHVPNRPDKPAPNMSAVSASAAKRLGTRYTVRRDSKGVRVWRVE